MQNNKYTTSSAASLAIPQGSGSQKTENAEASMESVQGRGDKKKSKIILSQTFNSKNTISSPSQQSQNKQSQNPSSSLSSNKARHHSFNGSIATAERGAAGGMVATNRTKKYLTTPTSETTTTSSSSSSTTTTLTILQQTTTSGTTTSSTKSKATPSSTKSRVTTSSSSTSVSVSNGNGTGNNKNFQIPSDILDDLASRFIINVPDMELNNLIRICFQIELAHWFYLDFFCTGTDEEKKSLQPMGMKYFAMQLFQHIPFLSQHLPKIDSVLEDWKNYKLAVPTFGAILISEDLQYCLLVQSYFAKSSWGFPKGKVNETEDPEHCATREVFEETGYDITGLLVPKDYIEAVINDQYTRLYIVCNVSLDTVFEPRTRNEIRCCGWFPIDSLPNNKNDAISKAKLGQNANSFFMILPFVKRLKKWVNEKRMKAGIVDSNNGIGMTVAGVALGTCGNTINGSSNNPSNCKSNDRRKYSTNGACQNNIQQQTANGALLKSPSLGYVGGEAHFNHLQRSNAILNTNSAKKNRQQQKNIIFNNNNNTNNNNTNGNGSIMKSNNVSGCFELSEIETTTFLAVGTNAVAASAAANARSKRQRHKSMGDLDNMNAFNNGKNPNSCNKNIYSNSNSNKRNSVLQKMNIVAGTDNYHNIDNAIHNSSSSSRRQLFHSQSQNDGVVSDSGGTEQITTSSFSFMRQERQQQQRGMEHIKYVQQNPDMIQYFNETVSISDEQTRKQQHIRQRAKSQSEKAAANNQQQFQLQAINDCYFSNNNNNNHNATTSRPNLQRQSSLNSTRNTLVRTATSNIINTADNKIGDSDEMKRLRRYTTATAPALTGNDLIAWSAARTQHAAIGVTGAAAATKSNIGEQTNIIKALVEASAIETRLIQEQKLIRQLEEVKQQQKEQIFPTIMTTTSKQQQQQQQQHQQQQNQKSHKQLQQQFSLIQQHQQQQQHSSPQHQQQQQRHPLQHSASSPGLATWKNFSFTKNLISNVFL